MVPRDSADIIQEVLLTITGRFLYGSTPEAAARTAIDGIFLAGACQGPNDIPSSVAQGSAAAARAATALAAGEVAVESIVSEVDEGIYGGCGTCVELCPYGAIELVEKGKLVAEVTTALCKGCGTCAAACLSDAMEQNHFKIGQLYKQIEGAFRDPA